MTHTSTRPGMFPRSEMVAALTRSPVRQIDQCPHSVASLVAQLQPHRYPRPKVPGQLPGCEDKVIPCLAHPYRPSFMGPEA